MALQAAAFVADGTPLQPMHYIVISEAAVALLDHAVLGSAKDERICLRAEMVGLFDALAKQHPLSSV